MNPISALNKGDLIKAVADKLDITLTDADEAISTALDIIASTVTAGRDVAITNFGTFRAVRHPARKARNPQTGEPVAVPERAVVRFRVSPRLQEVVRAGDPSVSLRKRTKSI